MKKNWKKEKKMTKEEADEKGRGKGKDHVGTEMKTAERKSETVAGKVVEEETESGG